MTFGPESVMKGDDCWCWSEAQLNQITVRQSGHVYIRRSNDDEWSGSEGKL
jgi:hypothetical protein